jgi:hypothetical protein
MIEATTRNKKKYSSNYSAEFSAHHTHTHVHINIQVCPSHTMCPKLSFVEKKYLTYKMFLWEELPRKIIDFSIPKARYRNAKEICTSDI